MGGPVLQINWSFVLPIMMDKRWAGLCCRGACDAGVMVSSFTHSSLSLLFLILSPAAAGAPLPYLIQEEDQLSTKQPHSPRPYTIAIKRLARDCRTEWNDLYVHVLS